MAESAGVLDGRKLAALSLRFYLPADYLAAWRGEAAAIIGADATAGDESEAAVNVRSAAVQAGVTHHELADHLERSRSFITKLMNGVKPWPKQLLAKARDFLAARTTSRTEVVPATHPTAR